MKKEIECIQKYIWEIVENPKDEKCIDLKWIFKIKDNGTYGIRLVAKKA